jgi:ribonuclease D
MQLAVRDEDSVRIALIDVPALKGDLGALRDILLDTQVLKIFHAGTQDIEILTTYLGAVPNPCFDTQVAAAFSGYSLQTGYGALVQSLLNVRLSKEEGFSDWSVRPLTPSMREYAANDVRYLHILHERLTALLVKRGRTAWAMELSDRQLAHAAETTPPENLWLKVSGRTGLDGKGLAILRELAIWRDEEAQRRNRPRRSVLKDELLVEIAKRGGDTAQKILSLRGAPPNLGERTAEALASRVREALKLPKSAYPKPEISVVLNEQASALVELLAAVVRTRAAEENLPPSLLATSDELRLLAASPENAEEYLSRVFTGWRGELIGNDLQNVLSGKVAVSWDKTRRHLILQESPTDPSP